MPSRRRRLAMLRVLGSRPAHATDEPDDTGMDGPPEAHDAGRDAARPRSAPAFCRPRPVAPRPYQGEEEAGPRPAALRSNVSPGRGSSLRWREMLAATGCAAEPPDTARTSVLPVNAPPQASTAAAPAPYPPPRQPGPPADAVRPLWFDPATEADAGRADSEGEEGAAWTALARGVALLFGTLLAVDLFSPGGLPAAGPWWLDTRPLPETASAALLGVSCAALVAFAARAALPRPVRMVASLCVFLLIALALKNATIYYGLLQRGDLHGGPPVAFPLHIAVCLGFVLLALRSAPGPRGVRGTLLVLVGFNAALFALPVAHIACCGFVDARTPATAAVLFGTRPFEAESRLAERVRLAATLQKTGVAARVAIAASADNSEEIKAGLIAAGVPVASIELLDVVNEPALYRSLADRFPKADGIAPTLLAVSDFDHLPRVVLRARRAGLTLNPVPVSTAPSREILLREIVELWRCYARR